jgi:hypothetical protein
MKEREEKKKAGKKKEGRIESKPEDINERKVTQT